MNESLPDAGEKQQTNEVSYKYILKFTGIFSSVQGLNLFVSIVRNKLAAVILGPAGMALVAIYNSITTFIADLSNLGIKFSWVRNLSELYSENDKEKNFRIHQTDPDMESLDRYRGGAALRISVASHQLVFVWRRLVSCRRYLFVVSDDNFSRNHKR